MECSENSEKIFEEMKDKLTSAQVLTLQRICVGYVVYRDASRVGVVCVLMKDSMVIVYASRQLNIHEKNYPTHTLELDNVVFALKYYTQYLYVVHVDVFTYHERLQYVSMQR